MADKAWKSDEGHPDKTVLNLAWPLYCIIVAVQFSRHMVVDDAKMYQKINATNNFFFS